MLFWFQEQPQPVAVRQKANVEPPAKTRVKATSSTQEPSASGPNPLSNGSTSKTAPQSVQQPKEDRPESRRRPAGSEASTERSTAAPPGKQKQAGGKPAPTQTAEPANPRSIPSQSLASADKPLQNGVNKRPEALHSTLQASSEHPAANQNGPARQRNVQSAENPAPTAQAAPTGKGAPNPRAADSLANVHAAGKTPTPRNGLHPKAAGAPPPRANQGQGAEAGSAAAANTGGHRRGGNKVGRSSNPSNPPQQANPQRRAPADNAPAESDRTAYPASLKTAHANGPRAAPTSKPGSGVGSPAKGPGRQNSGGGPAQNPWQVRAQLRENAIIHSNTVKMQRMQLDSNGQSPAGASAWPALGTSPGGTPLPTEDPTHPPQPAGSQLPAANGFPTHGRHAQAHPANSTMKAVSSSGYILKSSNEDWLTESMLQQMNLGGVDHEENSPHPQLPNGLLQSPTARLQHPLLQQQSAASGWQPLLGKAGFDWSLGMGSDTPLGGSFPEHGVASRPESGFGGLAAPLTPALDDSSLQQRARGGSVQPIPAQSTAHGLLSSQLSGSGGSGGLLREASAARPVPLSPLRTHLAAHNSPAGVQRTHSSLGSSDVGGSSKGHMRSPGSILGADARLLGQSGSPLGSGAQHRGSLVGSILGPPNGSQPTQAMPACIRQIWERESGGSGQSGFEAPRLDSRLASPIIEPSMWQPQNTLSNRAQSNMAASLRSYSHASR